MLLWSVHCGCSASILSQIQFRPLANNSWSAIYPFSATVGGSRYSKYPKYSRYSIYSKFSKYSIYLKYSIYSKYSENPGHSQTIHGAPFKASASATVGVS